MSPGRKQPPGLGAAAESSGEGRRSKATALVRYVEGREPGSAVITTPSLWKLRRAAHLLLDVMHGDVGRTLDALVWSGHPIADVLVEQAGTRARARDAVLEAVAERAQMDNAS